MPLAADHARLLLASVGRSTGFTGATRRAEGARAIRAGAVRQEAAEPAGRRLVLQTAPPLAVSLVCAP